MPNYCECDLHINGRVAEVKAAISSDHGAIDFAQLIPEPELEGEGWYDWRLKHWGTKWNATAISADKHIIRFQTAWDPPIPVFKALCARFPDVDFCLEYFEAGMCYSGGIRYDAEAKEFTEWRGEYHGFRGG